MHKRIYILYTGGTIGMKRSQQGYVPCPGLAELIRQRIPIHLSSHLPDYDLDEMDELIDSTNATPLDWQLIARKISENYLRYDGFVILHGTDTMAYTASALSFMLQGIGKPVIVTGSQIPLCEVRNDAQDNLITAMILASEYRISEVCLYFSGRLLRGNRSTKVKSSGFDAFDSPNYHWLGQVGIHIDLHEGSILKVLPGNEQFQLPEYGHHRIIPLRLFPGMETLFIEAVLKLQPQGLILQSFGVGNAPDRLPGFIHALEKASRGGVVILNLSQCLHGRVDQGSYATGSGLSQAGVIPGGDMTQEAALTKMHHLFARQVSPEEVREKLRVDLCGELTATLQNNERESPAPA